MNKRIFLMAIIIILCLNLVSADHYYADVTIDVSKDGTIIFDGTTNHPMLQGTSQEFTSKNGAYWLLNITVENATFANYIYELNLPENSFVNYLKTPKLSRIIDDGDGITIIGTGENDKFVIVIQYTISAFVSEGSKVLKPVLYLVIISLIAGAYLLFNKRKKTALLYNPKTLTKRQNQIMNVIKKNKDPITQAMIEKTTGLPKASLSRNIESLVKKNLIEKHKRGMSNVIVLKK
ncbi:MAG: MarR family transcriptional regulator [archaeon]